MRFVSLYYHLSCSSYREVLELVWAYSRRKAGDEERERGSRRGLQNVDQVRGSNSLVVERGWERRVGTSTTGYPRGFAEAAEPADKSSSLLDEEPGEVEISWSKFPPLYLSSTSPFATKALRTLS